jgi:hypothetical protein
MRPRQAASKSIRCSTHIAPLCRGDENSLGSARSTGIIANFQTAIVGMMAGGGVPIILRVIGRVIGAA